MNQDILLCHLELNNNQQQIDEFLIYQIFKKHILVKNVKVFAIDTIVMAYILVEDKNSLEVAIKEIHDTELNIGRILVFVSHKKNITFERSLKDIIQRYYEQGDSSTYLKGISDGQSRNLDFLVSKRKVYSQYKDYICESSEEEEKAKNNKTRSRTPDKLVSIWKNNKIKDQSSDQSINLKKIDEMSKENMNKKNFFNKEGNAFKELLSKEQAKTNLLKVDGINIKRVNFIAILNFFGCFGNISKLLTNFKDNYSIIEFETVDQTIKAQRITNKQLFFGTPLQTEFYLNKGVFKDSQKNPKPYIRTRVNRAKFYRYKQKLKIKVNKPTKLLHLTNLPSKTTPLFLYNIIAKIAEPINLYKLKKKGVCSDMFLVEFETVEKSIEVLSILHNKKVEDKLIKVSFSHTKVEM